MQDHEIRTLLANQQERFQRYAESIAREVSERVMAERQAAEDQRANRRNRNRGLTLVVALGMFFVVPPGMQALGLAAYLVYAPVIAIFPDALITFYAMWKKL